jgi:hypothetical protein
MTSRGPTRNFSDFTTKPWLASFAMSSGASIDSSFAQTLVATFTMRTSRSRAMGRVRSAMRGPTAARQAARGIGSWRFAKRFSPARSST